MLSVHLQLNQTMKQAMTRTLTRMTAKSTAGTMEKQTSTALQCEISRRLGEYMECGVCVTFLNNYPTDFVTDA